MTECNCDMPIEIYNDWLRDQGWEVEHEDIIATAGFYWYTFSYYGDGWSYDNNIYVQEPHGYFLIFGSQGNGNADSFRDDDEDAAGCGFHLYIENYDKTNITGDGDENLYWGIR